MTLPSSLQTITFGYLFFKASICDSAGCLAEYDIRRFVLQSLDMILPSGLQNITCWCLTIKASRMCHCRWHQFSVIRMLYNDCRITYFDQFVHQILDYVNSAVNVLPSITFGVSSIKPRERVTADSSLQNIVFSDENCYGCRY